MSLNKTSHKRYNPLLNEWVLVSPQRSQRPWQGQKETVSLEKKPHHDPNCYLCPGSTRANGNKNPQYKNTFVFTNDFSALHPEHMKKTRQPSSPLFLSKPETGICKVICFSPCHDLSIARMQTKQVKKIIDTWSSEYKKLGSHDQINYVQVFENKGEAMGCSNPHPHGQIWATNSIPTLPNREQVQQQKYLAEHKSCLLCEYTRLETEKKKRIIFSNDSFIILVPYWAIWPYEILILPKRHISSLLQLSDQEKTDRASALIRMGTQFDNLFKTSFPYSMGIHQQPTDNMDHPEWHFHIHYYPPLLRSATIKKFMVGYEMMAMPQRDMTAEESASRLQAVSEEHYLEDIKL